MKILVLLADLFDRVGGIQSFNRSFAKALDEIADKKGWELTVLVLNDDQTKNTVKHFPLRKAKYVAFSRNKFNFVVSAFFHALNSSMLFLGHVNFTPMVFLLKIFNLPIQIFLMVYGIDVWEKLPILQRINIKLVNKIISISNYTKQTSISFNSFEESRFLILPCTLDPDYNNEIVLKSKGELLLPDGKIILTVSRLAETETLKNIDLIIKTLPAILKEVPDAFYVIIGDGSDRARLESLTKNIGVYEKVIFAGKVTSDLLPSYYNLCDVFALPSEKEGFGIVFLEAMYYSKPCIGANRGGIPEVIEDGKSGFLIDPKNINSLSESMIKLLKDHDLCYSIGKAGKERLENRFSFKIFRERLEQILLNEKI